MNDDGPFLFFILVTLFVVFLVSHLASVPGIKCHAWCEYEGGVRLVQTAGECYCIDGDFTWKVTLPKE